MKEISDGERDLCSEAWLHGIWDSAGGPDGCYRHQAGAGGKALLHVLAVEPKGGATIEKEAFPPEPLPPGGGYVIAQPDEKTRRWEVSAYVWQPSQIIVNEGDEVTLEFVGIHGAAHPTAMNAFGQSFTLKRGQAHRVTFVADKAGSFGFICSTHRPSMSGELIVMPKR